MHIAQVSKEWEINQQQEGKKATKEKQFEFERKYDMSLKKRWNLLNLILELFSGG